MHETFDTMPDYQVVDAEYFRLLGYPAAHEPTARARELAAWARDWYQQHGQPWVYLRRAELQTAGGLLRLGGVEFHSAQLHGHLVQHQAQSAMLMAVSAGQECEEHARVLWQESKPDEYFFLEMYGSAVVENLVARSNARICELAAHQDLMAIPHYSPGYTGWDVAEQNKLFDLLAGGMSRTFPGPLAVLSSGMLRPKKSLLAVFGLAKTTGREPAAGLTTPCANCSFSPCQYRRTPYRHIGLLGPVTTAAPLASALTEKAGPLTRDAKYSVNVRALRKWATERVQLKFQDNGKIQACFRFDGTTCSNMGQALAYDYRIELSRAEDGHRILEQDCTPAAESDGYQYSCAYLSDPEGLMRATSREKYLLGRPLDEVLAWTRTSAPAGCHCTADSRAHKWGLALEAIHYSLVQTPQPQPV